MHWTAGRKFQSKNLRTFEVIVTQSRCALATPHISSYSLTGTERCSTPFISQPNTGTLFPIKAGERLDGLAGGEGSFTACSFWYIERLARAHRVDKARPLFEKMLGYANDVGLYAEELGRNGQHLENFPQAFTHLDSLRYPAEGVGSGPGRSGVIRRKNLPRAKVPYRRLYAGVRSPNPLKCGHLARLHAFAKTRLR
jgi:hypothetical protein